MDEWSLALVVIGAVITLVTAMVVGTWALRGVLGSLRGSADKMSVSVNHLSRSVDKLDASVQTMGARQAEHETRITVLESQRRKQT